ncbi:hypothetical protein OAH41_05670 [Paracoccaceae bacterium]|nr:hypothetical protein [Paracoccaceae bacterium]
MTLARQLIAERGARLSAERLLILKQAELPVSMPGAFAAGLGPFAWSAAAPPPFGAPEPS